MFSCGPGWARAECWGEFGACAASGGPAAVDGGVLCRLVLRQAILVRFKSCPRYKRLRPVGIQSDWPESFLRSKHHFRGTRRRSTRWGSCHNPLRGAQSRARARPRRQSSCRRHRPGCKRPIRDSQPSRVIVNGSERSRARLHTPSRSCCVTVISVTRVTRDRTGAAPVTGLRGPGAMGPQCPEVG